MNKVYFIIPVITIAFCYCRVHLFQSALHDVVHILDHDLSALAFSGHGFCTVGRIFTDKIDLVIGKTIHDTTCRFIDRTLNLIGIKLFFCAVLLDNIYHCFHSLLLYIVFFLIFKTIFCRQQYSTVICKRKEKNPENSSLFLFYFLCNFPNACLTVSHIQWKSQ